MALENELKTRANDVCEFCKGDAGLTIYDVQPNADGTLQNSIYACETCNAQLLNPAMADEKHWSCLNDAMWSEVPAVQITAWRMLDNLKNQTWASDLLDMLYLDEANLTWAQAGAFAVDPDAIKHLDSNGAVLTAGDTVTLIKDLNVKGTTFTAKRGTAVRRISLVQDNAEHIEGKVNGQQIVILTKFVKKSNQPA